MRSRDLNAWEDQARVLLKARGRPHFAPDPLELACHRRVLEARLRGVDVQAPARLLVLGATPELADLGLELGFCVLRVDSSPRMFEAAGLGERVADRRREQCLVADWRDLDAVPTGTIHAVGGDAALNNVTDEDMTAVLAELRRVLVPGGVLSLRQIVFPVDPPATFELGPVLDARRRGDLTWTALRTLVRFWCFRASAYDAATKTLDAARVYEAVEQERANGTWTDEEYAYLASSTSRLRHTIYDADVQEARLRDAFGPLRRHHASDALRHRHFFPIYEVRRA